MGRFRFYQVSGYAEIEANSAEEAKSKVWDDKRKVNVPFIHADKEKNFVFIVANGEPVEIDENTGKEKK